jgi:hypothetical protein
MARRCPAGTTQSFMSSIATPPWSPQSVYTIHHVSEHETLHHEPVIIHSVDVPPKCLSFISIAIWTMSSSTPSCVASVPRLYLCSVLPSDIQQFHAAINVECPQRIQAPLLYRVHKSQAQNRLLSSNFLIRLRLGNKFSKERLMNFTA